MIINVHRWPNITFPVTVTENLLNVVYETGQLLAGDVVELETGNFLFIPNVFRKLTNEEYTKYKKMCLAERWWLEEDFSKRMTENIRVFGDMAYYVRLTLKGLE